MREYDTMFGMDIRINDSIESFLGTLQPPELAKVLRTIDLLEEFGSDLGLPHSRHLAGGLLELRVRGKREVRIFYCFYKHRAVLLHAFIKKTPENPAERNGQSKKRNGAFAII